MNIIQKHKKKFILGFAALGIIISAVGGWKLVVYMALLITGIIIGIQFSKFRQLYTDYRLGLRINALMYSSKKMEEMQGQIESYEKQIAAANQSLALYKTTAQNRPVNFGGGNQNDNINRNGAPWLREDIEVN